MADHYEVLQVHPKADIDVIRAAFRTLARKYHPDFGGDGRKMMAINEAWSVLGDRSRRAAYDAARNGLRAARSADARATGGWSASPAPADSPATPVAPAGPIAAAAERRTQHTHATAPRQEETLLDFGRYAGWSVASLAAEDPDYLLWLERTPIGRPLRNEIRAQLERRAAQRSSTTSTATRPRQPVLRHRPR